MTEGKPNNKYTTISVDRETAEDLRAVRLILERRLTKEVGQPVRLTMIATLKELMRPYGKRKAS